MPKKETKIELTKDNTKVVKLTSRWIKKSDKHKLKGLNVFVELEVNGEKLDYPIILSFNDFAHMARSKAEYRINNK